MPIYGSIANNFNDFKHKRNLFTTPSKEKLSYNISPVIWTTAWILVENETFRSNMEDLEHTTPLKLRMIPEMTQINLTSILR